MTALVLIAAIGGFSLAFAVVMARGLWRRARTDPAVQRVSEAISGGIRRYLRRHDVVVLAAAGVLGAIVVVAYGVAYQTEAVDAVAPREFGLWFALSYVAGVVLAVGAGRTAAWANRRASGPVAASAARGIDETLQVGIRAAAVSGVGAMAAGVLAMGLLCLLVYSVGAPEAAAAGVPWPVAEILPLRLSGFVLGTTFVALLTQVGGGIFGKASDMGADIGGKVDASLPEDSPDNPATVADLVGDVVGDHAGRTTGMLATTATQTLAGMLVAAVVLRSNDSALPSLAFALFPLVAQSFGLLATCFGTMVVRTDDREVPMNALGRGLGVTTLLYAVAAVGAAKWLLGSHWGYYAGCAVVGAVGSLGCLIAVQYYTDAKYRPVRGLAEAARSGPTLATLRGLLAAIEGAAVMLVVALSCASVCYLLGRATGLEAGGLFGLAIGGLGLVGSIPFVLGMYGLGSIVDCAGGIVALTVGAERPDVHARARLLDAVGNTTKGLSGALLATSTGWSCFLVLAACVLHVWEASAEGEGGSSLALDNATLYVGALLGVVVVLVFVWTTLGRVAQAARDFLLELRGQLGTPPSAREEPRTEGDADPAPRLLGAGDAAVVTGGAEGALGHGTAAPTVPPQQLSCVETASRLALRGMLAPVVAGVGLPLLLGAALRIHATGDTVGESAEALVALLLVATIAGALGSLLFSNAGSAWDNAKKYIETGAHGGRYVQDARQAAARGLRAGLAVDGGAGRGGDRPVDNPTYVAAVVGDTIGDPLKGVVGPATQALVQTLSLLALVFLPFFL
ncbi:MAG: sodium/proton-translocating pyrophosphatase [Deltaproteobacteria bacterium]|jgi:K(+)-stimulated pyrophosphate-energized sodium pump|nr:sodium/proton-translocating pyrophosphatase [Deltaproteobacteria bacterium]MBW2534232.1 sodium/proton-translocating pyrophosphatase [Deltaproteobacteria bacterium]